MSSFPTQLPHVLHRQLDRLKQQLLLFLLLSQLLQGQE